jgi:phosphatidylglycerol:prolipoprotein diacylglycerol transferase
MVIGLLAHSGFVHNIDPVLIRVLGVPVYYYGLAYALGFLGVYVWFVHRGKALGWTADEAAELSIFFVAGVLVCGRAFEIAVYELDYYVRNPGHLLSWWRGGMASHGVLIGGLLGPMLFCRLRSKALLETMDELVLPAAVFLALGRIANFINGEIIGSVTALPWGVKFPRAEGFRHPVALYESAKNFAVVLILIIRPRWSRPRRGILLAHFVFWYGFLRIFTDIFREYGKELLGIGRGQYFNIALAVAGVVMFAAPGRRAGPMADARPARTEARPPGKGRRLKQTLFAALVAFSLTIPSSWTQGSLPPSRGPGQATQTHPAR